MQLELLTPAFSSSRTPKAMKGMCAYRHSLLSAITGLCLCTSPVERLSLSEP